MVSKKAQGLSMNVIIIADKIKLYPEEFSDFLEIVQYLLFLLRTPPGDGIEYGMPVFLNKQPPLVGGLIGS